MKNGVFPYKWTPLALAMAMLPMAGQAQEFALEEIVVTAQKREQSLQDVPLSVQAISADKLEQNSVSSISDISNLAPGVSFSNIDDGGNLAIRGVGTEALGVGLEQSTAIYIDGVYQPSISAIADLVDIAQIEILRGPQGTIFGRNAAAGAISIRTNAPTDVLEGSVKIGAGSDDLRTVQGVLNLPLSDTLLTRTSVTYRERDGWQSNTDMADGPDLYEQEKHSIRSRIQWLASDDVTVELSLDHAKQDGTAGGLVVEEVGTLDPTAGFDTTHKLDGSLASGSGTYNDALGNLLSIKPRLEREISGAAVNVEWDINDEYSLLSTTSYRYSSEKGSDHVGGNFSVAAGSLPYTAGYVGYADSKFETYSQEFRLSYSNDSIDWFIGANYYTSKAQEGINYALPAVGWAYFGASGGTTPGDLALGTLGAAQSYSNVKTESYALFGDVIFELTEKLNMTVGARYSYDKKEVDWNDVQQVAGQTPGAEQLFYPDIVNGITQDGTNRLAEAKDDWNDVSGRLVFDYQVAEDATLYAGVSQGYKSGGFNTELSSGGDPVASFDKEKSTNYEIGLKSTWMEGRLLANVSAFLTDYKDYQFQVAEPGSIAAVNLGADAEVMGVELEFAFQATENLTLSLSSSYLDTEYMDDVSVSGVGGTAYAVREGQDLARASKFSTIASADYLYPLGDVGNLRLNTTYSYSESYRLSNADVEGLQGNGLVFEESDLMSGSYGILNARIGLESADERWTASIWGTNLTDAEYRDSSGIGFASAVYGDLGGTMKSYTRNEPRMVGVDFSYAFGG